MGPAGLLTSGRPPFPPMTRYHTIVADPPWPMPSGGAYAGTARYKRPPSALPYPPMTLDAIRALPLRDLAAPDANLFLWTPNHFIEQAFSIARAWKFKPVVVLTWCKTPRGIGLGGAFTQTTEHILFARRGTMRTQRRVDTTWFHWTRPHNNHSAKPEAFLDLVESVSLGPYLEIFARRNRLGWDTWGNEALGHVQVTA